MLWHAGGATSARGTTSGSGSGSGFATTSAGLTSGGTRAGTLGSSGSSGELLRRPASPALTQRIKQHPGALCMPPWVACGALSKHKQLCQILVIRTFMCDRENRCWPVGGVAFCRHIRRHIGRQLGWDAGRIFRRRVWRAGHGEFWVLQRRQQRGVRKRRNHHRGVHFLLVLRYSLGTSSKIAQSSQSFH